jgi:hypothetical protein
MQQHSYILEKRLIFRAQHGTPVAQTLADLQAAANQLPHTAYAREAQPLTEILSKVLRAIGKNDRNSLFFGFPLHCFRTL